MEPIAIIGIGCRFPRAKDPAAFWQLLRNGVDAIAEIPPERWEREAFYHDVPGTPGKMSSRWGGFVEDVDQFDGAFFGISPRELERTDPQQRLMLEVAWEALEDAGLPPTQLSGTQTGVFVAIGNYDYCRLLARDDLAHINAYDGTGNTLCIAANRLSYLLNLRGPSLVIETACSSSLVALHFACRSLQHGESDLCLVGGVSLMLSPEPTIAYSQARMMAADGRCKTFDAGADGYVRGEGCGAVVLKRLSEALRDGDRIQGIIRGSAVNQDGLTNGLTAPNGPAQRAVIQKALQNAGLKPAQISYVEAHGTGTALGDPIEVKALKAVLMEGRPPDRPCWIGSVKTNIGHLEAAAGMASLIKTVLALQYQEIPPHLHLKQLNPYISLEGTPLAIPTQCQPWPAEAEGPFAGISAFGFGGTNCHAILEAAPPRQRVNQSDRPWHLLALSAKSEAALQALVGRYQDFFQAHGQISLIDACFTANVGRSHFDYRVAVTANSVKQLQKNLAALATTAPGSWAKRTKLNQSPQIAFLFTGQGSQYFGMGRQLYQTQPYFRQTLQRCQEILRPYLKRPLLEVLYHGDNQERVNQTSYTQPALFALEYALAQLWQSWGIKPAIAMGHSIGEYVAACVAGVFTLEDGLKLIAARGRLMQALPENGEMVAVLASKAQIQAAIAAYPQVEIAAINGPENIVISGLREPVRAAVVALQQAGIKTQRLAVSHGFHSALMEPILAEFEKIAAQVTYTAPRIPLVSNVTGAIATDEILTPEYWSRHLRCPVNFAAGIATLHQQGYQIFLEMGPKPILIQMGRSCLPEGEIDWLPSLRLGQEDWQVLLHSLGKLYQRGAAVDWPALDRNYSPQRLALPTYPFQRQRYWAAPKPSAPQAPAPQPALLSLDAIESLTQQLASTHNFSPEELKLLPKLLDYLRDRQDQQGAIAALEDWFYESQWQIKPRTIKTSQQNGREVCPREWLIFSDTKGISKALAERLQQQGHHCHLIYPGAGYQLTAPGFSHLNPANPDNFDCLLQNLGEKSYLGILHLWNLDAPLNSQLTLPALERAQVLGVGSLLHLVQALVKRSLKAKVWLITQGAMPAQAWSPEVAQTPAWGMAQAIALEHPDLWGGAIDLSQEGVQEIDELLRELQADPEEDRVAFRKGQRYVLRLVRSPLPASQLQFLRGDSTYLITGGLGALGLKVTNWAIQQRVKYLVLTSRRSPSPQEREILNQMKQGGAEVFVAKADVTSEGDMTKLLDLVQASMPPLRGIIHLAGVSNYQGLKNITLSNLEEVLRPKVLGSWILHLLTQTIKLDFFVNFSSIASVWGSTGQAHYAAANQFLDALAHYRRGIGLSALSINWGPWADRGMASEYQSLLTKMGVTALPPNQAIAALDYLVRTNCVQATVANIDWSLFKGLYEARKKRPLLEYISDKSSQNPQKCVQSSLAEESTLLARLKQVAVGDRRSYLMAFLQENIAEVLGLNSGEQPDPQKGLFEMGMDSLMAVELVSFIEAHLQTRFSMLEILEANNIETLVEVLLRQVFPEVAPLEVACNVLSLEAEAVLEENIVPKEPLVEQEKTKAVFLTGASGFLGAFLLRELLERTEATIYCLVRAGNILSGQLKLEENLKNYQIWQTDYAARIVPVIGDLSQPYLGLESEEFDKLAQIIEVIYHNGAVLNFVYPYSILKPTNVLGTKEILKLACHFQTKPLHYVSTDAVFDSYAYFDREVQESEPIVYTQGLDLGYTQSKWVAEKLVTIARDRGLPVTIYRPPLIAGDSHTGIWNTNDFTCRFIKGCIQMGKMPDMNCELAIVPVNYVSQAIVSLSLQKTSSGKAFHLNNPHAPNWSEVVKWINNLGYTILPVPYQTWEAELIHTSYSSSNVLNSLIPFFLKRWSQEQLNFADFGQRRVKLNCQDTVKELAKSNIACPSVNFDLLGIYFSYFMRDGFLDSYLELSIKT